RLGRERGRRLVRPALRDRGRLGVQNRGRCGGDGVTAELQYERVRRVETDHWWFVALRELVIQTLVRRHPDGGRVLDAGCGTGRLLRELPAGFARTGVDVEADVLAVAGADASEIELVEANLEQLPFADDS